MVESYLKNKAQGAGCRAQGKQGARCRVQGSMAQGTGETGGCKWEIQLKWHSRNDQGH